MVEASGVDEASRLVSRRRFLLSAAAIGGSVVAGDILTACSSADGSGGTDEVRYGFISAFRSGQEPRREIERNCLKLAVEEINSAGGIRGRQVRIVEEGGGKTARERITQLISDRRVDLVVGSLAASDHDAARSVLGRLGGVLIATSPQPGGDCSSVLVSAGSVPSQQAALLVPWLLKNVGRRLYVVAPGDRWSAATMTAISAALQRHGDAPVATRSVGSSPDELAPVITDIRQKNPDVVWSLFAGDRAVDFATLAGTSDVHALIVMSGWDEVMAAAHPDLLGGALTAQPWFMSLSSPESQRFVSRYQRRFGDDRFLNADGEAAYVAAQLYARAADSARTTAAGNIVRALPDVQLQAPRGTVQVDRTTHEVMSQSYLGQVSGHGTIDVHDRLGLSPPSAAGCPSR